MAEIKVGQRVFIVGSHPWAGHAGEIVRTEEIKALGYSRPVVRLDNGQECFVVNPEHLQAAPVIVSRRRSPRGRR